MAKRTKATNERVEAAMRKMSGKFLPTFLEWRESELKRILSPEIHALITEIEFHIQNHRAYPEATCSFCRWRFQCTPTKQ